MGDGNQIWAFCRDKQCVFLNIKPFLQPQWQWCLNIEKYGVWNLLRSVCFYLTFRQSSEGQQSLLLVTNPRTVHHCPVNKPSGKANRTAARFSIRLLPGQTSLKVTKETTCFLNTYPGQHHWQSYRFKLSTKRPLCSKVTKWAQRVKHSESQETHN